MARTARRTNPSARRTTTRRNALPLPARLVIIYALLAGATLLVVSALVVHLTRGHLRGNLDQRLTAAVSSFQEGPALRIEGPADLASEARDWLAVHAFTADELAVVRTSDGRVLTAAGGLDLQAIEGSLDLLTASESRWWDLEAPGEAPVRALSVPLELEGEQVGTLVVGASRAGIDETLGALLSGVGWASVIGLVLATVLGFLSVRRTLHPLRRMGREVAAIQETGDLSRRVRGQGPEDEVGRLADAFDRMLARLEEAFLSRQRFVSDASHELRTPLTVIRGQLELLEARIRGAEERQTLEVAVDEVDRMRRIVEDLLLLARLDEGLALVREPVEVELVMQEALLRGMAGTRREAAVETEPGLYALADPERLLQVLTNLVANSVRHAGDDARLELSAKTSGARVLLRVSDTGRGISADELPRVFDRLFRGASVASPHEASGAGLGLSIAASLVRAMDGEISVESRPGGGTTFTVGLPAAEVPRGAPLAATAGE